MPHQSWPYFPKPCFRLCFVDFLQSAVLIGSNANYRIFYNKCRRRLLKFETINRGRRLLKGGAYFEVRELNNIKCQNLVIDSET